jgi:acyl-CoA synthetase (AMP-forming)/AMP-acid ligase II
VIIVQKEGLPVASAAAAAAGIEKCRMILINGAAALNSDDPPSIEYLINRGKLLPPFYQRPLAPGGAKTKLAFLNFSSGTTGLPKESEIVRPQNFC